MNQGDTTMGWVGRVLVMLGIWTAAGLLVNFVILPLYTRQGNEIRVPDVRGLSISEARQQYGRRGFRLVVDDERFEVVTPPGTILDQFPAPGGWTKRGRRIHLAVSAGPPTAAVPDVIGIPREDAVFKVQAAGLQVESIAHAFSDSLFEGLVLQQYPHAGGIVDKHSGVRLTVSLGRTPARIVVPRIVDLPEQQARYLVLKAGLRIGQVTYDSYVRKRNGTVVIQEPSPGTTAALMDSVNLVVNRR